MPGSVIYQSEMYYEICTEPARVSDWLLLVHGNLLEIERVSNTNWKLIFQFRHSLQFFHKILYLIDTTFVSRIKFHLYSGRNIRNTCPRIITINAWFYLIFEKFSVKYSFQFRTVKSIIVFIKIKIIRYHEIKKTRRNIPYKHG